MSQRQALPNPVQNMYMGNVKQSNPNPRHVLRLECVDNHHMISTETSTEYNIVNVDHHHRSSSPDSAETNINSKVQIHKYPFKA